MGIHTKTYLHAYGEQMKSTMRPTHELWRAVGKSSMKWNSETQLIQWQDGSWSGGTYSEETLKTKFGINVVPIRPMRMVNK